MSKVISFVGSPCSGKTTVALKTAIETYVSKGAGKVAFVSTDLNVPSVGLIFPNYKPDEICSIGEVLQKPNIDEESLLRNMITFQNMRDMVALGYKAGDNRLSYPTPIPQKISKMFEVLKSIADVIIVDCSNDDRDEISNVALNMSDVIFRVVAPDLKGMAWLSSHKRYSGVVVNVMNITGKDSFLPIGEVYASFDTNPVVLPYSPSLRQQMLDGTLYEMTKDKKYRKILETLVCEIITD